MEISANGLQRLISFGISCFVVLSFLGITQAQSAQAWDWHYQQFQTFNRYDTGYKRYDKLDVLPNGNLLAHNADTGLVEILSQGNGLGTDGQYLGILGSTSISDGAIAHDSLGNIYLGNINTYTIDIYNSSYAYVTSIPSGWPYALTVDPATNDLYYMDRDPDTGILNIHKRTLEGVDTVFYQDQEPTMLEQTHAFAVSNNYLYAGGADPNSSGYLVYYHCLSTCAGGADGGMIPRSAPTNPFDGVGLPEAINITVDQYGYIYVNSTPNDVSAIYIYNPDRTLVYQTETDQLLNNTSVVAANGKIYEMSSDASWWSGPYVQVYPAYPSVEPHTITLPSGITGFVEDESEISITAGLTGINNVMLKSTDGTKIASVDHVDFSASHDWSNLEAGVDVDAGRAFAHGLLSQTGVQDSTFTLYVPVPNGRHSSSIYICPGAVSFNDVYGTCSYGYLLRNGETGSDGAQAFYYDNGGTGDYWMVSGLTGTGGVSLLDPLTRATISDTLSREQVGAFGNQIIDFYSVNGLTQPGDSFELKFDPAFYMDLSSNDIALEINGVANSVGMPDPMLNGWGVNVDILGGTLTFYAPIAGSDPTYYFPANTDIRVLLGKFDSDFTWGTLQVQNPTTAGSYMLGITITNHMGTESADINIPIVDSDQVNVTGFINTYINFDIDTGTSFDIECDFDNCQLYDGGNNAANYTVDLGELSSTWVNLSQDTAVMHSDGNNGAINSIYLDLTTNAANGATVTVQSLHGALQGPDVNTLASVTDGQAITTNSGLYGFNLPPVAVGNGTINLNSNCNVSLVYCGPTIAPKEVFNTNGQPLADGRVQMDLAAAAAYTNNPGAYTDTLTFIAVATF